jgi:type I restriction enzyme, S subunit
LNYFDDIICRAEDVPRLNEAILQLAVRGKLVEQDPADEPATELLLRIAAEKQRLGIKSKKLPEIGEEERPYPLPDGWKWVRLPEIYYDWGQTRPKKKFTYIDVSSINNTEGTIGDDLAVIEANDAPSRARKVVKPGTVIYSTVRPYLLNVAIVEQEFDPPPIVSTAFAVMHPHTGIDRKFLFYYLRSRPFIDFVESEMAGMAYPAISGTKLNRGLFPLPPLAEQKRIVARVDELLTQTRTLKKRLAQAEADLTTLHETAVFHLLQSDNSDDLAAHWQFIADNFDLLYDERYPAAALANVAQLKQAILQLAVQGKLTRQDANDEPAAALLRRIAAEKKRLGIKSKKLPEIGEEERPFALPDGWEWARFPELGEFGRGKSKHRPRNDPRLYENGKYPFVQTGEVARSNGYITSYSQMYGEIGLAQSKMWPEGTLCITIAANIAETGILTFDACFPDSVVGFVASDLIGSTEYFQYFVAVAKNELEAYAPATAQKNINLGILESLLIPLPPLAEMKRIVARVEALLRLCDDLAGHIALAKQTGDGLKTAVLS